MTFTTKFSLSALFVAILLCGAACGPTYVVQPTGQAVAYQQQYDPGYDPNQFLYDAMLANAVVNGINGYYGPGHVFYPMTTYGGVSGYYDSGHHFHTSVQNKTVVVNNYNSGREQFVKTHPASTKPDYGNGGSMGRGPSTPASSQTATKPDYGSGQGTIGRGAPTQQPASQGSVKPNYTSSQNGGQGSMGRGVSMAQPAVSSKPNYGSGGSMQRSAPSAPPSRPSYSPSSGSMGRRSK